MNEAMFNTLAESLYNTIEDLLDELIEEQDAPIDYENSAGVITIDCEDTNSQVIVTRQRAASQIWVAARSGGFHCDYVDNRWRCTTTSETLGELLSRTCTEQSDQAIDFTSIDQATE